MYLYFGVMSLLHFSLFSLHACNRYNVLISSCFVQSLSFEAVNYTIAEVGISLPARLIFYSESDLRFIREFIN